MTVVIGIDSSLTTSGCARVDFTVSGGGRPSHWAHPEAAGPHGEPVSGLPRWETWRARATAADVDSVAATRRRIRIMLREILALVPDFVDLSVVEGPAMGAKHTPLADERAGLRWMLIDQLLARGPVAFVAPMSRQALSGVGTIPRGTSSTKRKQMVADAIRAQFPTARVPDHNVADAVVLAAAGAHALGMPWALSVKQIKAHANVAWPVESAA